MTNVYILTGLYIFLCIGFCFLFYNKNKIITLLENQINEYKDLKENEISRSENLLRKANDNVFKLSNMNNELNDFLNKIIREQEILPHTSRDLINIQDIFNYQDKTLLVGKGIIHDNKFNVCVMIPEVAISKNKKTICLITLWGIDGVVTYIVEQDGKINHYKKINNLDEYLTLH